MSRNKRHPTNKDNARRGERKRPVVTAAADRIAEQCGRKHVIIAGIGASAGGLEAFSDLVKALNADTGMAFVLVQHLDPVRDSALVELLARVCKLPVSEVKDNTVVKPNCVYVIPRNANLSIRDGILHLAPRSASRGLFMPIDSFLQSLAVDQGSKAIGVILSGSATDGTLGLRAIKASGGITFAQDKSAKYDSMPRSAVGAGCVDFILPPHEIARELTRLGRHPYLANPEADKHDVPTEEAAQFNAIFSLLQRATGVDFANYKHNTLKRRIQRRMVMAKIENLNDYAVFLRENPAELDALSRDVLIHVTHFFRDPESFEALKKSVFPALIERTPKNPIRLWIPGCSTGEEVYSLAICLLEFLNEHKQPAAIKVFATDISEEALAKARLGVYPDSILAEVSPSRLRQHFLPVDRGYQISKSIRDICVFARHDVTRDPPFSNLDLISCRNVLIYLGTVLQKRVMPVFHYALKPAGFLLLGCSENTHSEFFYAVDKKHNIFHKKATASRPIMHFAYGGPTAEEATPADGTLVPAIPVPDVQKDADRIVLARYAPAGVVINAEMQILQFRGHTGPFLESAPGAPNPDLLKMAREGLTIELRAAVQTAAKKGAPVRSEGLFVRSDGASREINIEVIPMHPAGQRQRYFVVLFEDLGAQRSVARKGKQKTKDTSTSAQRGRDSRIAADLQRELAATKEYLQSVIEKLEIGNEELKSASEEILSSNEELQSTNEELETAKEELQATNEELTTLNEELQSRNAETAQINSDLLNLLGSAGIPIVMLDRKLRIRRFTPSAQRVLKLLPADVGRPLSDLKPVLEIDDLDALMHHVIESLTVLEREVRDRQGRWYSLCLRPYRTIDNKIDGVVLSLADIDALKRYEALIHEERDQMHAILDTVADVIVTLNDKGTVQSVNAAVKIVFGFAPEEIMGRNINLLMPPPFKKEHDAHIAAYLKTGVKTIIGTTRELTAQRKDGVVFPIEISVNEMWREGAHLFLGVIRDMTRRKEIEAARVKAEQVAAARERLAMSTLGDMAAGVAHEFRNPLHGVLNCVQIMRTKPKDEALEKWLDLQEEGLRRMDAIATRLLRLGKDDGGTKVSIAIDAVIDGALALVSPRAHTEGVALERSIEADLPPLLLDAERISEALLNLLGNALDACGKGDTIKVNAERGKLHEKDAVIITVTDNGTGIAPEFLPRVFEPFFTTKPVGKGSGLGLALVKKIVERHQGTVELTSKLDAGTTVTLTMPA